MKLYHYTTSSTLVSILQNKQIWFTDFRFLNDAQEGILSRQIVQKTLSEFNFEDKIELYNKIGRANGAGNHPFGIQGDPFEGLIKNLKERLPSYRPPSGVTEYIPYVFSLSEDCDSLSQWRAYGKGELCIEFDADLLAQATGGRLLKIDYKDPTKSDVAISVAIHKFFDNVLETYRQTNRFDPETFADGYQDVRSSLLSFQPLMSLKHIGFKDELERRLVLDVSPRSRDGQKTFIDGGRYPTPRLKANISNSNVSLSEVITGIVFGPGSDEVRAEYAIKALNLEFELRLKSHFSKVPYRA